MHDPLALVRRALLGHCFVAHCRVRQEALDTGHEGLYVVSHLGTLPTARSGWWGIAHVEKECLWLLLV